MEILTVCFRNHH